ncbi:DNA-3-methyladenine glycosylase [Microbacterium sp. HA-8]|uniref:DNA-3-methyladenine glycosylase n=1 Tax=Microbacterium sp. HA-8 TaxID=3234200 RepID=UPI0038F773EA
MTERREPTFRRGHRPATRADLEALPLEIAPRLLGGLLATQVEGELVVVRLTEVEAYHGLGTGAVPDPGSHARAGQTARNATMWGEPGHLYVYLSHGIHSCVNVVCGPDGVAGGVLLRAGEIVEGQDVAVRRRPRAQTARDLARGPGRLGQALGLRHPAHDGIDAIVGRGGLAVEGGVAAEGGVTAEGAVMALGPEHAGARARLDLPRAAAASISAGPRVGVAGVAGTHEFPWRFWIAGDPTVSSFRWGRGAAPPSA